MSCDPAADGPFTAAFTPGVLAALRERGRQIGEEGFDDARDDRYRDGELAAAAACYLLAAAAAAAASPHDAARATSTRYLVDTLWPWDRKWWKPEDSAVVMCTKAAALAMAEIDRLARCVIPAPKKKDRPKVPEPKEPDVHCCCGSVMQIHYVHEVASLLYCPRCSRVAMEGPDGITELRPVPETVSSPYWITCSHCRHEIPAEPFTETLKAHQCWTCGILFNACPEDVHATLPKRTATQVCCPVCDAVLATIPCAPGGLPPDIRAINDAYDIAAPIHAERSPSCVASDQWHCLPILKPVLKGPSDAVPH